jgi:hypothetical protein
MTDDGSKLPTPAQALQWACRAALEEPEEELSLAHFWLALARELREGSTRPLVDRALDRLTLHDVEGIVCAHGRVAVRRKNAQPAGWFLHADDGSNCDVPHPETDHRRRCSQDRIDAMEVPTAAAGRDHRTEQLDMSRLRPQVSDALAGGAPNRVPAVLPKVAGKCRSCGQAVRFVGRSAGHREPGWYHDLTMQSACVRPLGQGHYRPTFAEPDPAQ